MDLTGFDRSTRISSRSGLIHGKLWIPHLCKAYYEELIKSTVNMHPLMANYIDIDHDWRYLTVPLSYIVIAIIWACTPTNGKIRRSWLAVNFELLLCKLPNYSYFFRDRLWAPTSTTNVHFKNRNRHTANLSCIVIDAWYQYQMSVPGSECMVPVWELKGTNGSGTKNRSPCYGYRQILVPT